MSIFTGSGVAIVTPFDTDGSVNFKAFEGLVEYQLANETDAIIACGTTGEASTLTDEEQIECIRFVVDVVKKRVPVIAGAGSNDTNHGIRLCKLAEKQGADALLLITPYYNRCTQKGLIRHFTAQAQAVDIPVIIYNMPARTGVNILPATAYELSKVDNIVAIKEACGNINQIADLAQLAGDRMDIYSGCDEHIVPILSLGGKGVISVLANVAPKQTHNMVMKYLNGDHKGSLKLQLDMLPLTRALFIENSPIPVKAALNMMGLNAGGYRMPLCEMDENNYQILKHEMEACGLI